NDSNAPKGRASTEDSGSDCGSRATSSRRAEGTSRCRASPATVRRSPSSCRFIRRRVMPPGDRKGPILVVDDDPDVRDALVDTLQDEGYEVVQMAGGREALEYL